MWHWIPFPAYGFWCISQRLKHLLSLSLCFYVCVCVCVWLCAFSVSIRRTEKWCRLLSQWTSVTDSPCWICFLDSLKTQSTIMTRLCSPSAVALNWLPLPWHPQLLALSVLALIEENRGPGDAFSPTFHSYECCQILWPLSVLLGLSHTLCFIWVDGKTLGTWTDVSDSKQTLLLSSVAGRSILFENFTS